MVREVYIRMRATVTCRSADPIAERTFIEGMIYRMLILDESDPAYWSSTDIDGAFIVPPECADIYKEGGPILDSGYPELDR